ncbi:monocarboxylate transporter 14-like [Strongylocentrotus purpuratus]|uniref:Major facilitator superfamily (MFS) profile domain-containing protein n=1 Tax=Strongylocentrotus purpuratus TaxID=7668 RepID=A0A7M7PJI5_STRPU|nr:monocarboxylate transporter 14-like [Strongylocentrotus purpuratus]
MTMVVTNPYAGLLADKYGHRQVIFVGGVISSLAILASSFATDFTMLTITYGLVGGIGFGLSHMPAIVMLSRYFDTKIGTATGLAMSGTGLGTIFMSIVTQYLVDEFGWRGTMMILSAINAHLCVAAAVMRPVKLGLRRMTPAEEAKLKAKTKEVRGITYKELPQEDPAAKGMSITANPVHEPNGTEGAVFRTNTLLDRDRNSNSLTTKYVKMDVNLKYNGSTQNGTFETIEIVHKKAKEADANGKTSPSACCRVWSNIVSFLDSVYGFVLWKNPMYLSFLMGINLSFFGMTVVSAHVAKRALEYGIEDMYSTLLVAVLGLSQAVGRIVSGPLVDRCRLNPLRLYQSMAALCGVSIIFSIYLKSFSAQVVFCALAGYTTGACATLQTVMCVSLFGPGQMKYAYPGVILAVGIAMLTSPPIAGLCRDLQGNYLGAFFMAAAACFSSVVAHLPLSCTIKPGKKHAHTPIEDNDPYLGDEFVPKV